MSRKKRSDSKESAANMLVSVVKIPSHVYLRECDVPFWDSLVRARARDNWTDADLENAANLARSKADIERIQREITSEGDVIINAKGTQIVNPKHTLLETLSRRVMALSRMLHVHPQATSGQSKDEAASNKKQQEMNGIRSGLDGLIAPPIN